MSNTVTTNTPTIYIILGKDRHGNTFIPMGVHPTVDLSALTRMKNVLESQHFWRKGNTYEIKKLTDVSDRS